MPGFRKDARLLTPAEFDAAFKAGKRLGSGPMLAVIADNAHGHARLGFAIAKRHAKTAVQRNRIRRVLREAFRLAQQKLPAVDLVITLRAKPPVTRALEGQALQEFWTRLMERLQKKTPCPAPSPS